MLTKANNSTEGRREQGRGWHGHFLGFWARLNCEEMPVIPAWLVRRCLDDPRRIPYLLIWKDERDGEIKEAVRLARYEGDGNYVELKRTDGDYTLLRTVWRMLPRNGGRALLLHCFYCNTPRRHVYGWEWDSFSGWSNGVRRTDWCCRACNRLRYSSEGGHLRGSGRGALTAIFRAFGNLPRPEPWLPYVFTSPKEAEEVGVCELSSVSWYGKRRAGRKESKNEQEA